MKKPTRTLYCNICMATTNRKGKPFTKDSLKDHRASHFKRNDFNETFDDPALEMADLSASDESDGVYWGIASENGYFG